jgi:hypothetical protein
MQHAIAELEVALATARNNEPIHRSEGNIEQADHAARVIEDCEAAIAQLSAKPEAERAESTEQRLNRLGKTAPRVTEDRIQNIIVSEHYFTAADGCLGEWQYRADTRSTDEKPKMAPTPAALQLLTFCVLVLENGFTVTGESACASPENFDEQIGREIAYKDAIDKVWLLEGYLLKERLWKQETTKA